MRKAKLKELYDRAKTYNEINDVCIDCTIARLNADDITVEDRKEGIELLKTELETRKNFNSVETAYKERKAEDRGYWIGVSGCCLGIILAEVGPVLWKHFKTK